MNDLILKVKPHNVIRLFSNNFYHNINTFSFQRQSFFTFVQIFIMCLFVQNFHTFSTKSAVHSILLTPNRNELSKIILELIIMVIKVIWFKIIRDGDIQINLDNSVTMRWNRSVA